MLKQEAILKELAMEWVREEMEEHEGEIAHLGEVKRESEKEMRKWISEDGEERFRRDEMALERKRWNCKNGNYSRWRQKD